MPSRQSTHIPLALQLRHVVLMVICILMALPVMVYAQNPDIGHAPQPSSRIRLIGLLMPRKGVLVPEFPWLRVWVGGKPWLLQVCHVEPLIPAYPAVEQLRKVTDSGLRFLTDRVEQETLQYAAQQGQPVEIEGQLRVRARRLRVDAARMTEVAAASCPTNHTVG